MYKSPNIPKKISIWKLLNTIDSTNIAIKYVMLHIVQMSALVFGFTVLQVVFLGS